MRGSDTVTRRTVVRLAGAAATAVPAAGCLGDDETGEEATVESGDEPTDGSDEDGAIADAWERVEEIELETNIAFWIGLSPEPIADEQNPTLVLFEGREYAITWQNADEFLHNLELRDENDDVVDGYSTPTLRTEGESETLEFEASPEIAEYVCDPHEASMRGDVEIVEGE